MNTSTLLPGMDAEQIEPVVAPKATGGGGSPRLRLADREQVLLEPCEFDRLVADDHEVRTIWAVAEQMDLSAFYGEIQARGSSPGRASTDPRILIALWLYATKNGVGSGRELDRLCREHTAYRWLRGGVALNYHTLNDFRVCHGDKLDRLFTNLLSCLVHQ